MRRLHFAIVSAAVMLLATGPSLAEIGPQEIKRATNYVKRAERAWRNGALPVAKTNYRKALEIAPSFPEAHIGMGNVAMREREFEDALRHYERARDGYGELHTVLFDFRSRQYVEARTAIQEMQDKIRELQSPTTTRPDARYQISKLENLISEYRSVRPPSEADDTRPAGEVYFYIGNALFQLERIEEAIEAWETCRERSPLFAMTYNNLALAYMKQGRIEEARESLATAEKLGFPVDSRFKQDLEKAESEPQGAYVLAPGFFPQPS